MKHEVVATVTVTQRYVVDSKGYPNCEFVEDAIAIDKKNFKSDPLNFICGMLEFGGKATVEIKKVK
jgi:hypothetical protein